MTNPKVSEFHNDPMLVRTTFAQFPSGVSVLAFEKDGEKHALVASSFMVGVSLEPTLVAVAVQKTSETWPAVEAAGRFGVSIFGTGQGDLTRKLAGKDRAKRFEDVAVEVGDEGAVFVEDAALWLDCSIYSVSEAGDHWMALLEVHRLGVNDVEPLIWHGSRFRDLRNDNTIDVA